jgi:(2Fe-2S) ferredoxin
MSKVFKTPQQVIYVCTGSKCKKKGGKELSKLFRNMAKAAGLKDTVEIIKTDCTDRCKFAPVMSIQPQNIWLHDVNEAMAGQIFNQHIGNPTKTENPSVPES